MMSSQGFTDQASVAEWIALEVPASRVSLLCSRGRRAEARAAINAALEIVPGEPKLLLALAVVNANQHDYETAFEALEGIARSDPGNEGVARSRAFGLRVLRCFDEAREVLDTAVTASPGAPGLHLELGYLETDEQHWEQALAAFETVERLDPGNVDAAEGRTRCLRRLRRFHAAREVINAALLLALGGAALGVALCVLLRVPSGAFELWWVSDLSAICLALLLSSTIGLLVASERIPGGPRTRSARFIKAVTNSATGAAIAFILLSRVFGWVLTVDSIILDVLVVAVAIWLLSHQLLVAIEPTGDRFLRSAMQVNTAMPTAFRSSGEVPHTVLLTQTYLIGVALATMAFAFLTALLLDGRIASAAKMPTDGRELYVAAFQTQIVELLDGIPVLDLSDSLRLNKTINYSDRWTGTCLVIFKLMVLAPLVPMTRELVKRWQPAKDASS